MPAKTPVIHHHPAHQPSARPPLLFVHGGYSNAALWGVRFIPYFQDLGYDCYALELSGHGSHPADRTHLDDFGLDDYVADLAAAVAGLPAAPVLIGHSMGSLVSQRFLERGMAQASTTLCDDARVVYFEDATHWVQHEKPNEVNALLSEFFR